MGKLGVGKEVYFTKGWRIARGGSVTNGATSSCLLHIPRDSVQGRLIKNVRGNLAQGCPSAMNWFSYGIDPLLCFLERRLEGIPIFTLPVHGPVERSGQRRLAPLVVERFKVLGPFTLLFLLSTQYRSRNGNHHTS